MKLLLAWMAGATIVATPLIAAEAADVSPVNLDGVLMPISNLVGMGFVVWFARHTVISTVPSMQAQFSADLKQAFAEAATARAEFHEELVALAESHQRCAQEHRAAIDRLTESLMQMVKQCGGRVGIRENTEHP